MRLGRACVLLLALLSTGPEAFAQERGQSQTRTIVVRAARMFDGRGERVVSPGVVVVAGGRIVAAGPSAAVPAGAEVIDLGDATLLPGFMDCAHAPVGRGQRRLEAGRVGRAQEVCRRAGARRERLRASDAAGGLHDRARLGLGRVHRRGAAQRRARRQDLGAADARRPCAPSARPAGTATRPSAIAPTSSTAAPASPPRSPTAPTRCAPRSASTSSTAPTSSRSAPRAACSR